MVPDLMVRNAVRIGLEWLTKVVQPDGAAVSPRGASVVLGDRAFEFGMDPKGRGVTITVVNAGGEPVAKADRLAVERVVSELGFGVVAHDGFTGGAGSDDPDDDFSDDFGRVVVAVPPHPSLLAAMASYASAPYRIGRPAAVGADFTTVLEAECERLRELLSRWSR